MSIRFLLFYKAGTVRSVSATYNNFKINWWNERKSYLVVSALNSRLDGRWRPILDGNGVKTMLGLIPALNSGSFND